MSLRINDLAPDFNVELLLVILTSMNGGMWVLLFSLPRFSPVHN